MFHSKRMKAFPRVAWPSLYKGGDVTNWCHSMRDFSGVASPDPRVVGGTLHCYCEKTIVKDPGGSSTYHNFFGPS
jgi:hypothetical protein